MASSCDFPVFDADNHLYETKDAFTRHLPARYKVYMHGGPGPAGI